MTSLIIFARTCQPLWLSFQAFRTFLSGASAVHATPTIALRSELTLLNELAYDTQGRSPGNSCISQVGSSHALSAFRQFQGKGDSLVGLVRSSGVLPERAVHRFGSRNRRYERSEDQAFLQLGVAARVETRILEQLARAAAEFFGQTDVHEERSDERVLREGAEGVRLQGPFERSPAGVLGSNALVVDDDFCREGAGELAMNETVSARLN